MQRRVPSHPPPPTEIQDLASAESIDPKRDRLVESIFQKKKGAPPVSLHHADLDSDCAHLEPIQRYSKWLFKGWNKDASRLSITITGVSRPL
jgi:hypothetical protein